MLSESSSMFKSLLKLAESSSAFKSLLMLSQSSPTFKFPLMLSEASPPLKSPLMVFESEACLPGQSPLPSPGFGSCRTAPPSALPSGAMSVIGTMWAGQCWRVRSGVLSHKDFRRLQNKGESKSNSSHALCSRKHVSYVRTLPPFHNKSFWVSRFPRPKVILRLRGAKLGWGRKNLIKMLTLRLSSWFGIKHPSIVRVINFILTIVIHEKYISDASDTNILLLAIIFLLTEHQNNAVGSDRVHSLHRKEVCVETAFSLVLLSRTTNVKFTERRSRSAGDGSITVRNKGLASWYSIC